MNGRIGGFIRRERLVLAGLLLILFVRVGWIAVIHGQSEVPVFRKIYKKVAPTGIRDAETLSALRQGDAWYYDYLASRASRGESMDCPPRLPGKVDIISPMYPLVLSFVYRITGRSVLAALLFYALLDALTAVMYVLLIRLSGIPGSRLGQAAFLCIFAMYLPYIIFIMLPATEGLFTFLMALFFVLIARATLHDNRKILAVAGAVLGLAVLTRPIAILFPGAIFVLEMFRRRSAWRKNLAAFLVLSACMMGVILPWTVRNYIRHQKLVLVNSNANLVVVGTDTRTSAGETKRDAAFWQQYNKAQGRSIWRMYGGTVLRMLKSPLAQVRMWFIKFIRLWFNIGYGKPPSIGSWLTAVCQLVLIIGAGVMVFRSGLIGNAFTTPILFGIYTTFFHVIFFTAKIRFVIPILPGLMALFSLYTVWMIETHVRKYNN